jgi:cell wall-associated NlpC family hydrolase
MSINWNKYIGKKYVFNGRSEDEFDCIGLLINVYRDQGWAEDFNDGSLIESNWFELEPYRFARYMLKHFDRVEDINRLTEGDIILWEINGESHTAIYAGYGKFLSTFPPLGLFNGGKSFMDRLKFYPQLTITGLFKRRSSQ